MPVRCAKIRVPASEASLVEYLREVTRTAISSGGLCANPDGEGYDSVGSTRRSVWLL